MFSPTHSFSSRNAPDACQWVTLGARAPFAFRTQLFYDGAIQRLYSVCVVVNEKGERCERVEKVDGTLYTVELGSGQWPGIRDKGACTTKPFHGISAASFFLAYVRARMDKGNVEKNVGRSTNGRTSS